ncbi:hypothetical protein ACN28C_03170 [Plantactinospora sp. WMMC1484]|uniref:hypothetical protein n=1 Tax=Plantactinospora sp. WMMC1484 TaxID=3404122 RepID=UPI003BF4E6EE
MEKAPKKSTGRDVLEHVVAAAAGLAPVIGGPAASALTVAMSWTYQQRLAQWFDDVAEMLTDLESRPGGRSFEDLASDEGFADAFFTATRAAQATHRAEKLAALRNGVLNSLSPDAPELDEQLRFFRLVDQFTPAHLRLLHLLDDPTTVAESGEPERVLMGPAGTLGDLVERIPAQRR